MYNIKMIISVLYFILQRSIQVLAEECQWYEVLLDLHMKSAVSNSLSLSSSLSLSLSLSLIS